MHEIATRLRDDPRERLPWLVPLALVLTMLSQFGFLSLLRQPATPAAAPAPVDVQVVELPMTVSPPAARPPAPARSTPRAPAPPKPREEARTRAPAPAPVATQIEAPRDPVPAAEASAAAPGTTLPATVAAPAPSAATGPPAQTPVAALAPGRGPQGPPGGTDTMSARAIYKPMPEIPESLRHRTVEVIAVARFRVAADGRAQVELTEPTNDPGLNRALLETLGRWRFFPAMQAGKPVASTIDIRIPISVQ
ncbi:MAG TPA: TonB family protein [Candidatus Nitrosotalea sp.]|nr:TonB family protein [Candidatus Nitrosotalea sp.]